MRNCNCNRNRNCDRNCNRNRNCNCNCNRQNDNIISNINTNPFPVNYMYGHCYTPNQRSCNIFTPQAGLQNGSLFPELVSPYFPGQSMEEIEYLRYYNNENGGCRNV